MFWCFSKPPFLLGDLYNNPKNKAITNRIIPQAWLTFSFSFYFPKPSATHLSVCSSHQHFPAEGSRKKKTRFGSSASVMWPIPSIYCNLMLPCSKAYYTLCIILGSVADRRLTAGWKYTLCGVGGKMQPWTSNFLRWINTGTSESSAQSRSPCSDFLRFFFVFFFFFLFFLYKLSCVSGNVQSLQIVTGIGE